MPGIHHVDATMDNIKYVTGLLNITPDRFEMKIFRNETSVKV